MNTEQLYSPRGELTHDSGVTDQQAIALQELPTKSNKRKLFVKVLSLDVAFLFAHRMQKNKYLVKIENESRNIFKECGIMPYDIIEINESVSADAIIDYIIQNHDHSMITILLPE